MSDTPAVHPEPIGSRPGGSRTVRIIVEGPPSLKRRLEAFGFETGLTVAEVGRYALWEALLEAEADPRKFVARLAERKLLHREEERVKC